MNEIVIFTAIASIIAGLIGFAVAADRWGVDTRPPIGDDHAR